MDKACNDSKDSTHRKNIVEVSYYVICIMEYNIEGGISKNNASESSDCE